MFNVLSKSDKKTTPIPARIGELWMTGDSIFNILSRSVYKIIKYCVNNVILGKVSFRLPIFPGYTFVMNKPPTIIIEYCISEFWNNVNETSAIIEIVKDWTEISISDFDDMIEKYVLDFLCLMLLIQEYGYSCDRESIIYVVGIIRKKCYDAVIEVSDTFPKELYPIILSY